MTKNKSVEAPNKKKPEPKFSVSVIEKFPKLSKWLKELVRFKKLEDIIYISDYVKEKKIRLHFYTKNYRYYIVAIPQKNSDDNGYLGCQMTTRKARAGEDWNRGNDLADGNYSKETWQNIKNDILCNEIVKVVRNSPTKREFKKRK